MARNARWILVLGLLGCSPAGAVTSAEDAVHRVVELPAGSPELAEVKVEEIKVVTIPGGIIQAPGRVDVIPTHLSRVALPVPGRVDALLVAMGDDVKAGQPLLRLKSPDAQQALATYRQARAALAQAQSTLAKQESDFDRSKDLFAHEAIAQKELINAQNNYEQAVAAVLSVKATVAQSEQHLAFLGIAANTVDPAVSVVSPRNGKVYDIAVGVGEFRSDTINPVMTIADLSVLWVTCEVPEHLIALVDPGEHLEVAIGAFPDEKFQGKVTRVLDRVDPKTRTVTVICEFPNPQGRFRPEMFCRVRHEDSAKELPVIPAAAVITSGAMTSVFVETGPGRFELRVVELSPESGGRHVVQAGLEPGEKVAVRGVKSLKDRLR